jgi:ribonuclease Z
MQVVFLGTGEVCDPRNLHSSIVVADDSYSLLLDCGATSAHAFFGIYQTVPPLAGVWLSHFHGDHFLGLPFILLRFYQEKREDPLFIIGGPEVREKVTQLVELVYPGLLHKLTYKLLFNVLDPGELIAICSFELRSCPVEHISNAQGIRVDGKGVSLYYSGDGRPTSDSVKLMQGTDLIIHEAFILDGQYPGHSSVNQCLELKKQHSLSKMALIHLSRELRDNIHKVREMLKKENVEEILLPEDGDRLIL